MLIVLGGLPGVGKTTIARELAREIGAVHVRIDSIEEALRASGTARGPMDDSGYRVAYAIAEDNLRLGRTVIADSVNPLPITRDAWVGVATRTLSTAVEFEIICSDPEEHQRRVETRPADIPGSTSLTWQEVVARDYRPWDRERVVIDTAHRSLDDSVKTLIGYLRSTI